MLTVNDAHDLLLEDPLDLFDDWLRQAQETEPNDPNAAALATSTRDGMPSVRMVLAKRIGPHRFCFFTNSGSRKGIEIAENPRAALCFHWKILRRQVRVEGTVSELEAKDADQYFHSRSRTSQIGAVVSAQSRFLASREDLEDRVRIFGEEHSGEIPRPSFWNGFYLHEARIEFWLDGANRLHDRFLFTRQGHLWQKVRLYP
jgi:pyridoxamine 5'-phosphate oxidase